MGVGGPYHHVVAIAKHRGRGHRNLRRHFGHLVASAALRTALPDYRTQSNSIYRFLTTNYCQGTSEINYLNEKYKINLILGAQETVFRSEIGIYEARYDNLATLLQGGSIV